MNHLNALLLESVAHQLDLRLKNRTLADCYSNSSEELILDFDHFHIKCLFYKGEVYFFFYDAPPSKSRLFKPQFAEITGLKALNVIAHPFERSFQMEIENGFILLFKCHGRKSNIILFENSEAIDHFRSNLEKDLQHAPNDWVRSVQIDYSATISDFKRQFPFLPDEFESFTELKTAESFKNLVNGYRRLTGIGFNPHTFDIYKSDSGTLLDDITRFSANFIRNASFADKKSSMLLSCLNEIREKENFIRSNLEAINHLKNKRPEGEIGNIILANLHLIRQGMKSAEVMDIYNSKPILVSLDDNLSPVENAEKYFKKEKSAPISLKLLESKVQIAERKLLELRTRMQIIQSAYDAKDLKPLIKQNAKLQEEEHLPYRKFQFQGYDILVGKHAESNERLLNYYSDKNDVWLHARDVSGSHVILKVKGKLEVPTPVLEHAASIAAYYSKNRNQELATVSYTLRKYVRKIKGAEKGKVTISNDKSLLVKPHKGAAIS